MTLAFFSFEEWSWTARLSTAHKYTCTYIFNNYSYIWYITFGLKMGLFESIPLFLISPFYMVTSAAYNYTIKIGLPKDVYDKYAQKQKESYDIIFDYYGLGKSDSGKD